MNAALQNCRHDVGKIGNLFAATRIGDLALESGEDGSSVKRQLTADREASTCCIMSAKEFGSVIVRLPFKTAKALVHQCEKEFLLPRQVLARCFGEPLEEAVVFKIPDQEKWYLPNYKDFSDLQKREVDGRGVTQQTRIYLSILAQIVKAMPEKFSEVAPTFYGTKRVYFGKARDQIEATGTSNKAAKIPGTEWWAAVDNDRYWKEKTLTRLMAGLGGFSHDYIGIISRAPYQKFPMFSGIQFKSD